MTVTKPIMLAVLAVSLTACSDKYLEDAGFKRDGKKQTGDIEFVVKSNGNELEIANNPNRRCESLTKSIKFRRGCFNLKQDDYGEFTFKFKQTSDQDDYYFARFQICSWNGGVTAPNRNSNCLSPRRQVDFSVTLNGVANTPDAMGIIYLDQGNAELEEFTLNNENIREGNYFYWVDVCPKGEVLGAPGCLTVDPGSRNGGIRR